MDVVKIAPLLLIAVSIVANAYWQDAVRWENERRRLKLSGSCYCSEKAAKHKDWAMRLFRVSCLIGAVDLIAVFLDTYKIIYKIQLVHLAVFSFFFACSLWFFLCIKKKGTF